MRLALFGYRGKVGRVLADALESRGDDVVGIGPGAPRDLAGVAAALDFTAPNAVLANVRASLEHGVPCAVGTSGADLSEVGEEARERGVPLFFAPNFAVGAVLMMRFAVEAARHLPKAEIIELHHDRKLDAPSGTAARTAELMRQARPGDVPIHSVRLPGLVAHQEVILGDVGQTLTIRHDSIDRESFMPGVLLAVRHVADLPESPTVGLEHVLWPS